jgi:hypothetical protein
MRAGGAVVASILLASCATGRPSAVVRARVEGRGVVPGSGAVAWSPDGRALAVVRPEGIALLDLDAGSERLLSAPGATAVDWAPADSLLVVERLPAGGRTAVAIDPGTGASRPLHSDPALVAARWLHAGRGWVAVAATREVRSYGTRAIQTLTIAAGGRPVEVYRWDAMLPVGAAADDAWLGWGAARPSPLDHTLLLATYRKPPVFAGYVQVLAIDPLDPVPEEVGRFESGGWNATATWSGEGDRAAVAAADGSLRVVRRGGAMEVAPGPVRGLHPSWSPRGDLIFLGGWLATPAAEPVRQLVDRAEGSMGFWSPAGDRLAVVASGRLFVFGDLPLPPADEAAERRRAAVRAGLWELGALRASGLISPAVHRERRDRLGQRPTEGP